MTASSGSVNSRLQVLGGHISGRGTFDAFSMYFCVLGVFRGGGIWDSGGGG